MLNFYAKSFLKLLDLIIVIERELEADEPQAVARSASQLEQLGQLAETIEFSHIAHRAHEVFRLWRDDGKLTRDIALHESRAIRKAFLEEVAQHLYFLVPVRDRLYYEKPLLGPETASKFPAADKELQLAGKCFALDQHTAAVYHAMRALEAALVALALRLRVPKKDQSWGKIIDSIEGAIKKGRQPKKRLTPQRRKFLDACSEAAIHFRFLKDAWRNHTMHQRQNYNRGKGEDILRHVSQFLEQLAGLGIKEQP